VKGSKIMAQQPRQPQLSPPIQNLWQQALIAHQKNQLTEAIAFYQQIIAQKPDFADAHANLAMALSVNSQYQEADQAFNHALSLEPNNPKNHSNYGFFLSCLEQNESAEKHLRQAVQLNPQLGIAWFNLGNVLRSLDRYTEAVSCYQVAYPLDYKKLEILSDWVFGLKKLCRWSALKSVELTLIQASANQINKGEISPINPFVASLLPISLPEFQQICISHAQAITNLVQQQGLIGRFCHGQNQPSNRIKVGYVCAAFGRHPTGHLIEGLFERHDRAQFEIYGYGTSPPDGSPYRQKIENTIEHFRDVHNWSHLAIADQIFQDAIEILIDLDGYTSNHRQQVFALKPAPIQVTWLGFPGTTGGKYMDYLIADSVVVPPSSDSFYTEAIVRLPHTYQINNHRQLPSLTKCDRQMARQDQGLPSTGIVFCSFNNNTKIDHGTYDAWLEILKAVANSVLWILADTSEGLENLRHTAEKAGVDPRRIIPASRLAEPIAHLQRLQLADLYLDCFIYNAHTTAADALWAGVPVLTCAGETFASRVGASLVQSAELAELICQSPQQFVAKAIELGQNPQALQILQEHLYQNKYNLPIFNTDGWVRDFEKAMTIMAEGYYSSKDVTAIDLNSS
jgi:protein O-GlcNAc transferase